jgi:hypothetical protein
MGKVSKKDIYLTEEIVSIYREIYYEHYKPIAKLINPNDPNYRELYKNEMMPVLNKFGWTLRYFEEIMSIDLFQRFVYDTKFMKHGDKLKLESYPEYRHLDPNYGALRLKCPLRTEQPDEIIFN